MRYALYYTPEPGNPLLTAAEEWLGRSAFGSPVAQGGADDELVADARRYGFHATLKAPFELAPGHGEAEFKSALGRWAGARVPVVDIRLRLDQLSGFFALVPAGPHPVLEAFAADLVRDLDAFRAPLSDFDRARRRPEGLSERQRAHLERWGYPYVLDEFRFHMTLTSRLDAPASERVRSMLEERFAPFLAVSTTLATIALFKQGERDANFDVEATYPLMAEAPQAAFGSFDNN